MSGKDISGYSNFDGLHHRSDGDGATEKEEVSTNALRSSGDGRTEEGGLTAEARETPDENGGFKNVLRKKGRKRKIQKPKKVTVKLEEEPEPPKVEPESELSLGPLTSFEHLTADVHSLVEEIGDKAGVYNYVTEYLRMFQSLHDARENFDAAKAEVKELQEIRSKQDEKIKNLKLLLDEQNNFIKRKKERLFFVTSVADAALIRDQESRAVLGITRIQLSKMLREMERLHEDSDAEEIEDASEYEGTKSTLVPRGRSQLLMKIETLNLQLKGVQSSEQEANAKVVDLEKKMSLLASELESERLRRLSLEDSSNQTAQNLELFEGRLRGKEEDLKNLRRSLKSVCDHYDGVADNLMSRTNECEKSRKDKVDLAQKLLLCERRVENLKAQNKNLSYKNTDLEASLSNKIKEMGLLSSRIEKLTTQNLKLQRENTQVIKNVDDLRDKVEISQKKLLETKKELKEVVSQMSDREIVIKDLNQEKNLLEKRFRDQKITLEICEDRRARQEATISDLRSELQNSRKERRELKIQYDGMARKKDMLSTEVANMVLSLRMESERVDLAQAAFAETQKTLIQREAKYALLVSSKENVEKEKQLLSHQFDKEQEAKTDALAKVRTLSHALDQFLEESQKKQRDLLLEVQAHKKTEVAKRHFRNQSNKLLATVSTLKAEIANLKSSLGQCTRFVQDMASKAVHLERKKQEASEERTVIATQLIRRNDELKAARDRMDFLERSLFRGEAQYQERIFDLKLMRTEIKNLRTERGRLDQKIKELPALRKELFRSKQDCLRVQIRERALENEVSNPLNVSCWRKVQVTDHKTAELSFKVSLLQKRLISQSDKVLLRDDQLQEAQRLYLALRETLLRRPACEKQLMVARLALDKRNRKLKALQAEVQILTVELSSKKREKNASQYPYCLSFPPIQLHTTFQGTSFQNSGVPLRQG